MSDTLSKLKDDYEDYKAYCLKLNTIPIKPFGKMSFYTHWDILKNRYGKKMVNNN